MRRKGYGPDEAQDLTQEFFAQLITKDHLRLADRLLTNFHRPFLYAPDAAGLWLTKDQRSAGFYDARTLEPRLLLPTGILPLATSPDGRHLAVSVEAQRLQVWDLVKVREQLRGLGLDWSEGQP